MDDQEVALIDYLRILWRRKWVIAVTFIAAVVAAWGASQAIAPTYRSEASLLLLPSLVSELGAESVGSILEPNAYRMFAKSTAVLRTILEEAELAGSTSIEELRGRLEVSLDPLLVSEDRYASVSDQVVLTFSAAWPDPEEAAAIVTAWLSAFEEGFGEVFLERTLHSAEYFQQNLDQAEAELASVIEQRTELLSESPLDIMRGELTALLTRYSTDVARLYEARDELEVSHARLTSLEDELAKREPIYTLRRTLDPDSLAAGLAFGLSTREYQALIDVESQVEVINETYSMLDASVATERTTINALESELNYLQESVATIQDELAVKQRAILTAEARLEQLDAQITTLRSSRTDLATKLLDARIALADTLVPIRVIDEPLVPRSPIAPKQRTNISVAGVLGLILGTLLAFFVDYLARVREQEGVAHPKAVPVSEEPQDRNTDQNTDTGRTDKGNEPPQPVT